MVFENWVENIQAAAYNGARTVNFFQNRFLGCINHECLLKLQLNCNESVNRDGSPEKVLPSDLLYKTS